jgi:hypothetical protein
MAARAATGGVKTNRVEHAVARLTFEALPSDLG